MRALLYILFVLLNFCSLFYLPEKVLRRKLVIGNIIFFLALYFGAVLTSYLLGNNTVNNYVFSMYVSCLIIIMLGMVNQFFHFIIDKIVNFHLVSNSENINKYPIRLLIKNQQTLKKTSTYIWFAGSLLMLYGAWFKMNG